MKRFSKRLLPFVVCLLGVNVAFAAMSVDNYFAPPQGTASQDNILTIGGTQNIADGGELSIKSGGTLTLDSGSAIVGAGNVTDIWIDLAAASSTVYVDSATYNIALATLASGGTVYTLASGDYTNQAESRNVTVTFVATNTATTDQMHSTATVVISGYLATGEADTETITAHDTEIAGNKAWRSVTSYTVTAVTATFETGYTSTNVAINIGMGNKIGLSNSLYSSTATDLLVNEAGSRTTTATFSTTYSTVDFATDGDASNDYKVTYESDGQE